MVKCEAKGKERADSIFRVKGKIVVYVDVFVWKPFAVL